MITSSGADLGDVKILLCFLAFKNRSATTLVSWYIYIIHIFVCECECECVCVF